MYDKMRAGAACRQCTTLYSSPTRVRAAHTVPPRSAIRYAASVRRRRIHYYWMALHALMQCTARLILANVAGEAVLAADWAVVRGFATLGMEERARYSFRAEPDREAWKKAFELFCTAFHRPRREDGAKSKTLTVEEKRVATILRKPLPDEIETALFDYDKGFLPGLGRMSLNLEAHGGLYTLHAHLNHSYAPNVSVRHIDQRHALSRITLKALADI
ncbi:hypothetical protein GGX14DRAFT_678455 [Mycena pura]|uniref:Uncharacterized protein n=1 Tax=Mycena pura TaxID=153505 RepID=A0AAD6UUE9_9AGAR|nr:hypothetical protein GGX14DRAFT_678455 [Mycena pura]